MAPKPTALKILEGNPGKRPLNTKEPKPKVVKNEPPNFLSEDAKAKWLEIAPRLERLGILTEIDYEGFAGFCQCWSRWKEAEENVTKEGMIYTTAREGTKANPSIAIANKYLAQMTVFISRFGLSPSDRAGLVIEKDDSNDTLSQYLSG
jgi:P27 family predicted phage terminase small subunit